MLNCKQATEMASQGLDRQLSLAERFQFRLHLAICKYCRNYTKHLKIIKKLTAGLENHIESDPIHRLSPEARQKIQRILEQKQ